jgi:subtilisin-like proprotein convertase family protein
VEDSFLVGDASISLDVSHRRIGGLEVRIIAAPDATNITESRSVLLKEQGLGRLGANMYVTSFNDRADLAFPSEAEVAPFTGSYRPTQRLSFLWDDATSTVAGKGGSKGAWMLNIHDIAPNSNLRSIALNGWTLVLCELAMPGQEAPRAPLYANPPGKGCIGSTTTMPPMHTTVIPPTTPEEGIAPVPTTLAVTAMDGPSTTAYDPTPKAPLGGLLGWNFGWNGNNAATAASTTTLAGSPTPEVQQPIGGSRYFQNQINTAASTSTSATATPTTPIAIPPNNGNILSQYYGNYCTDASCSNIKTGIMRTIILSMLVKNVKEPGALFDKVKSMLPKLKIDKKTVKQLNTWVEEQGKWLKDHRVELLKAAVLIGDKMSNMMAGGGGDGMDGLMKAMAASGVDPTMLLGGGGGFDPSMLLGGGGGFDPSMLLSGMGLGGAGSLLSVGATNKAVAPGAEPAPLSMEENLGKAFASSRGASDLLSNLASAGAQAAKAAGTNTFTDGLQQMAFKAEDQFMGNLASQIGLNNADELAQVWQGLQDAGLADVMGDFLNPV